jgi:hypothetical protein
MRVISRVPPFPLPRPSFWFASFLPPFQGSISFGLIPQGGARFTSFALGYYLSGFHQPFGISKHQRKLAARRDPPAPPFIAARFTLPD